MEQVIKAAEDSMFPEMTMGREEFPKGKNFDENVLIARCKKVSRHNASQMAIAIALIAFAGGYYICHLTKKK